MSNHSDLDALSTYYHSYMSNHSDLDALSTYYHSYVSNHSDLDALSTYYHTDFRTLIIAILISFIFLNIHDFDTLFVLHAFSAHP